MHTLPARQVPARGQLLPMSHPSSRNKDCQRISSVAFSTYRFGDFLDPQSDPSHADEFTAGFLEAE